MKLSAVTAWLDLFALLISISTACSGKLVSTYVHEQFVRYYTLERRGCPESITLSFYTHFIDDLIGHVDSLDPTVTDFGAFCLDDADLQYFESHVHTINAIDDAIDTMHFLDSKMFFLPNTSYSDVSLHILGTDQQSSVNAAWATTSSELMKAPNPSLAGNIAVLPKAIDFFYDPHKVQVEDDLDDLLDDDASHNKYIDAEALITEVFTMVIRMEFLGISRLQSMQMLKHCVAFVFSNVRATRKDGDDLAVLNFHVPFYKGAYSTLIGAADTSSVDKITADDVGEVLQEDIKLLASFDSWGKLTHYTFDGSIVSLVNIEDHIFHPSILQEIADEAGISYSSSARMQRNTTTRRRRTKPAYKLSGPRIRTPGSQCDASLYYHLDRASVTDCDTSLECCCPNLCTNSPLLETVQVYSEEQCCDACNQLSCVFDSSNPLINLATVHITPYGYEEGGTINVMI